MKIDKESQQIKSNESKNTEFKLKHIIKISLVIGFFLILTLMGLSYMLFHDTSRPQEFSMPTTTWEPPKCNISSECKSYEICKENICTELQCGVNQIAMNHNCYDKKFITSEDIIINDGTTIAMNMTFELAEKEDVLVDISASRNGGFFFYYIDVNKESVVKDDMDGGIKTIGKSFLNKGENSMTVRFKSGNSPSFGIYPLTISSDSFIASPTLKKVSFRSIGMEQEPEISCEELEKDIYTCVEDEDCISVKHGCCGCEGIGEATAINKNNLTQWDERLAEECKNFDPEYCKTDKVARDWSCFAKPKCVGCRCVLRK